MVIKTIKAASIQIVGMDINLISMLYNNEPDKPPICMVNDLTDKTEALISLGVSELRITPSGIMDMPNIRYIEA